MWESGGCWQLIWSASSQPALASLARAAVLESVQESFETRLSIFFIATIPKLSQAKHEQDAALIWQRSQFVQKVYSIHPLFKIQAVAADGVVNVITEVLGGKRLAWWRWQKRWSG